MNVTDNYMLRCGRRRVILLFYHETTLTFFLNCYLGQSSSFKTKKFGRLHSSLNKQMRTVLKHLLVNNSAIPIFLSYEEFNKLINIPKLPFHKHRNMNLRLCLMRHKDILVGSMFNVILMA